MQPARGANNDFGRLHSHEGVTPDKKNGWGILIAAVYNSGSSKEIIREWRT